MTVAARVVLLVVGLPLVTYGGLWLTVRCAEDVRDIVDHVRRKP